MATYKVIQDIEAEDKLVGPLTLRQFIYAGVAAVCLYICFLAYTRGAQFLIIIFLPIACGAGFFAFPWKGEQPTEIWALARLRFAVKPRVRIWDQDGMKDLVTVLVPKKIAPARSAKANLSQMEVRSRLKALADTIDSRGWATRNAAYGVQQTWAHPTVAPVPAAYGPQVSMPSDDMFSEDNNVAQNFDAMLARSTQQKRQRVLQEIAQAQMPTPPQPQPQYQQMAAPAFGSPQLPAPLMPDMPVSTQVQVAPASIVAPPTAAPNQQQASPLWFASGPAYPTNPAAPAQTQTPAMPMPMMPTPAQRQQPTAQPAAAMPTPGPMPMPGPGPMPMMPMPGSVTAAPTAAIPTDSRIESDAPLAAAAVPSNEDVAMGQSIKEQNQAMAINYGHMRVLQPVGDAAPGAPNDNQAMMPPAGQAPAVTHLPDPAILELANNDDLDIATIARQANKEIKKAPEEVEIRLH